MRFEWDEDKNRENIRRHGFDFAVAWEIFLSPMLVYLDTREDYGEDRWSAVGTIGDRVVKLIYTESDDGTFRIISLRKAIKYERDEFKDYIANRLGSHRPDDG